MSEKVTEEKGIAVWNNVLTAALKVPGAKVNRDTYLKKELEHFYSAETVDYVIKNGLENSKVENYYLSYNYSYRIIFCCWIAWWLVDGCYYTR